MSLLRRRDHAPMRRTWSLEAALKAWCPVCETWLDGNCSLRRSVLTHKCETGHFPELYTS